MVRVQSTQIPKSMALFPHNLKKKTSPILIPVHRVPTVMENPGKSWEKSCHGKVMETEENK